MIKTQVTNTTINLQDIFKFNCPQIRNRIMNRQEQSKLLNLQGQSTGVGIL